MDKKGKSCSSGVVQSQDKGSQMEANVKVRPRRDAAKLSRQKPGRPCRERIIKSQTELDDCHRHLLDLLAQGTADAQYAAGSIHSLSPVKRFAGER